MVLSLYELVLGFEDLPNRGFQTSKKYHSRHRYTGTGSWHLVSRPHT
jgi:hypothetical protein